MTDKDELALLRKILMREYLLYQEGKISEKEYCIRTKPVDRAIGDIEMSILQDRLVYKVTFLQHSQKLEH